ncbi:hypothetical protein O988_03719 [Pseudogymnoascus sp. VKM F-3808]|nr:hypothetical protein O988_03719 [Pseudogymnoascus sp. VKM F-3808]
MSASPKPFSRHELRYILAADDAGMRPMAFPTLGECLTKATDDFHHSGRSRVRVTGTANDPRITVISNHNYLVRESPVDDTDDVPDWRDFVEAAEERQDAGHRDVRASAGSAIVCCGGGTAALDSKWRHKPACSIAASGSKERSKARSLDPHSLGGRLYKQRRNDSHESRPVGAFVIGTVSKAGARPLKHWLTDFGRGLLRTYPIRLHTTPYYAEQSILAAAYEDFAQR